MMHDEVSITAFQQRVYEALLCVPEGRVTTYAQLAKAVGCGSPRAVGQALRRNPFAPEVPCHRVIASDLTIGGFSGQRSGELIDKKRRLLESEGVKFAHGKLVDQSRLFSLVITS